MNNRFFVICSGVGTAFGATICYKEFLQGCRYSGRENLDGKTAIITGANTGIGKETAKEFVKRGARVILACRDMERCKKARREIYLAAKAAQPFGNVNHYAKKKPQILCELLDLASHESVRAFGATMQAEKRIDYLINNAATMRDPQRKLTKDGLEKQMGVNHFGHFLLTGLLLGKLQASSPSRIVVLSSTAHYRGDLNFANLNWDEDYDPGAAYNASKLANVLFTRQLSTRLASTSVTVNAVHPGLVYTELFRNMSFAKSMTSYITAPIMWFFMKSARAGAQTTLYVALSPDLEGVSGKYFSNCQEAAPSDRALDEEMARRLWAVSEKWTGWSMDQVPPLSALSASAAKS
ncbi:hypothetical protein RvY_13896-2 [Ramazzottius varieornatus]|uniref:Retinol dehydrogenase 13 n=1 Tax=Ramazzottius varieornatus TaxID=947166 RepID=A0A1D1VPH6_RAMVA|nr:hypothetical protein RvY_13896-2 [Ramazzottius varieornatus]